ncbi:L-lactate dehydrogenase [Diplonema papillatum]|nr:L-lactate dehydrogenase [Diplonema papillatum]
MGRKVVVIGAGAVGCSYIYVLMQSGLATEIVLVDIDAKRVEGEVMDLNHGLAFSQPAAIHGGTYADCANADLIVITAGAKQKPNETRLNLVQRNAQIMGSICDEITKYTDDAVVLVVSNPVDILTHVAIKRLAWPRGRVLGSGTVLDSARFRYMLSKEYNIDPHSVHAYILGEHGDSEIAAWSISHIGGQNLRTQMTVQPGVQATHDKILKAVRESAYHIIDHKGSTYYGIGLALLRITKAILRDERSMLTVSTLLKGEFELNDICLSVPCVVGRNGIESVLSAKLADEELKALHGSAAALRKIANPSKL